MEVFRINIKPQSEIERYESFKRKQHNCPICDSDLTFDLENGPESYTLLERAKCPSCDLEIRVETHTTH